MSAFKQFAFKKIGFTALTGEVLQAIATGEYNSFIKILFLTKGSRLQVDFKQYNLEQDAVFFVNAGQWFLPDEQQCHGWLLYYNRDFYCVALHDKEVACDGILFHNVYEIPMIYLNGLQWQQMRLCMEEITAELHMEDSTMEEMLRILLKQIIIRSTRIWKAAHQYTGEAMRQEIEFARQFSQLVEAHYTARHAVADYAEMLHLTPKALHKRLARHSTETPNDIIKNRIILEAKRLLVHTLLSVKEIGYKLGYDDPAYFVRLFTTQAGVSPQHFRKQYQLSQAQP